MQVSAPSYVLILLSLGLFFIASCDRLKGDTSRGQLLAEVGSQQLYLSDVAGVVPPGLPVADSTQILADFVGRWVRDAAVSEEAISQLGESPDIERLVDQYRTSLARDRYETLVASERIDTIVTQEQLVQTYENSKAGLSAKQDLLRAILIKMPSPVPDQENFEEAWSAFDDPDQWASCLQMAKEYSSLAFLDKDKWYTSAEIDALVPKGSSGSIKKGSSVSKGDGHVYYLRVIELVKQGEVTPLPYVRERLRKIILEQRKSTFLGAYTEELYQAARTQNSVKIYIGNDQ